MPIDHFNASHLAASRCVPVGHKVIAGTKCQTSPG